tara:strand:- start:4442 stop:6835 length:2394 start_codon:yes stop_codon:yes gene_type:complete
MSRIQQYQSNFTLGEIDPLLRGRIDLKQYYSAVATAKNVLFEPQGGFSRRPGLKFLLDITSDNAANGVMLIPFEFTTTQNFMIVATAYNTANTIRFRFYADQTLITNINGSGNSYLDYSVGTMYSVSNYDLKKLYFTQSADTLICVHENLLPFKLVRGANDATWTASAITLIKPKAQFTKATSNPSATITPDATDGTVNVTASSSVFTSSHVDQYINVNSGFGRARIIEYTSGTVVKVVTDTPFFEKDVAIASGAWELETGYEDAWSATRGYPRTCTFHEGRLFFGGSATLPNTLFGSKVGQYFDFKADEGLDDDALQVSLTTDSVNAINALRSGRDLQIFTSGAEFFVPQADLDPITPSNIVIKSATRRGSKANIRPQAAEGGTLFIQRQGKALREMLFSDVELSYVANNISLLSSHLIIDPQKMALRPATDTTEGDLLMVVNGTSSTGYRAASTGFNGGIAAFVLNKGQNIVAPSFLQTDGDFLDVGVDLDDIYTVVKRELGTNVTATVTVTDYANIAVGTKLTFTKHDGTVITLQSEASGASSPTAASGNTHYFRPHANNDTTADNIYTALNAVSGLTVANPASNVVSVVRDVNGLDNVTVTTTDSTRLAVTNFVGDIKYYLEVFDDDFTTDSAVQKTSSFSGTTYSGHTHLEGKLVSVVRDDIVDPNVTVSSGNVTVASQPTSYMEAGINFSVEVKTMPFEPNLPSGTVQSQKRRIVEVTPILYRSQNIALNNTVISLETYPASGGGGVPTFTGPKKTMGFRGYNREAQITITQTQPVFLTVLSLDYKVAVGQ